MIPDSKRHAGPIHRIQSTIIPSLQSYQGPVMILSILSRYLGLEIRLRDSARCLDIRPQAWATWMVLLSRAPSVVRRSTPCSHKSAWASRDCEHHRFDISKSFQHFSRHSFKRVSSMFCSSPRFWQFNSSTNTYKYFIFLYRRPILLVILWTSGLRRVSVITYFSAVFSNSADSACSSCELREWHSWICCIFNLIDSEWIFCFSPDTNSNSISLPRSTFKNHGAISDH